MSTDDTNTEPSAPHMEMSRIERLDEKMLPRVDPEIEGDGIDDEFHQAANFLKDIGTGSPDLRAPNPKMDKTWPPIPEDVQGIDARFFRKPDFITDGADDSKYNQDFMAKANQLGWLHSRNFAEKGWRRFWCGAIACTGVGAFWIGHRYKRIHHGEIGFCTDINESVRLLKPGMHCEYNPTHGKTFTHAIVKDYISFMDRAHIVRVHPGEYVVVKNNDQYSLLEPGDNHAVGVHMFDDPTFEFVQRVKQTSPAILAGPINIITVPPGRLARILIQNRPYILFEGQHKITSGLLNFGERILSAEDRAERKHKNPNAHKLDQNKEVGFSHLKDTFLYHLIGKVYVKPGQVVGVQINRRAVFLDIPGDYWFYSDQIEISKAVPMTIDQFQFSSLLRVYIKENEFGVVQKADGALEILHNGCHVVETPNKFLVSLPKTVQFREVRKTEGITMAPLDVVFNVTMAHKIVEPFKAYLLGSQMITCHAEEAKKCENDIFRTIDNTIRTSCTRSMQEIVRHLIFKDMMLLHRMSKEDLIDDEKKHNGENMLHHLQNDDMQPGSLKSQFQNVSKASVRVLAKTLLDVFGVELIVADFGISKLDLKNQEEQNTLNRAAFEAAKARTILVKAENDKRLAEYKKEMAEIVAKTRVAEKLIEAKSSGQIAKLNAMARAEERTLGAQAQAEELKIMTAAQANETVALAEAEAQAIRVKGEAEGFALEKYRDRTDIQMVEQIARMFKGTNLTIMDSQQGMMGPLLGQLMSKMGERMVKA
jgi:hypothetical protein